MASTPVLRISSKGKLSYLSVDSIHQFIIDDLQWFSVEHYLLGKRFEGTSLENKIRGSKNIAEARLLSTPRYNIFVEDGRTIRRTIYGPDKNNTPKSNWTQAKKDHLMDALKAKFEQNLAIKKRLMDLEGITFKCDVMPSSMSALGITKNIYSSSLMSVRDEFLTPVYVVDDHIPQHIIDATTSVLSVPEVEFVKNISRLILWIKEIEGTTILYPEMCFDALSNILDSDFTIEDVKTNLGIFNDWSDIISNAPKFYHIIKEVQKILTSTISSTTPVDITIASSISIVIKNYRGRLQNNIYTKAASIKRSNVIIPPEYRSYRSTSIPSKVHRKHKNQVKHSFGDIAITMDTKITIDLDVEIYKDVISTYGGKIIHMGQGKGEVEFPISKMYKVEEMIYNTIEEPEKKVEAAYYFWIRRRLDFISDILKSISTLSPDINDKDVVSMKMIMKMMNFPKRKKRDVNSIVSGELKNYKIPMFVKEKLIDYLVPKSMGDIDASSGYSKCILSFDRECGWNSNHPSIEDVLPRLYDIASATLPYEKGDELAVWCFLSIIPKELKLDASNYILMAPPRGDTIQLLDLPTVGQSPPKIDRVISIAKEYIKNIKNRNMNSYTKIMERLRLTSPPKESVAKVKVKTPIDIAPPTPHLTGGLVIDSEGDLRTFTDAKWICVISNSTSLSLPSKTKSTKSEEVTRGVYERYPYSNIYAMSDRVGAYSLGDVVVSIPRDSTTGTQLSSTPSHRYVITLIAEFSSGNAKKITDTKDARRKWFSDALSKLYDVVGTDPIAFSSATLIDDYRDMIVGVTKKVPLNIYILSSSVSDVLPPITKVTPPLSSTTSTPKSVDVPPPTMVQPTMSHLTDDIERGIIYTKLFKPHHLTSDQHTSLVSFIESLDDHKRDAFISSFVKMPPAKQRSSINKYLLL
jgi:predicted NAD-dependent protein-ADP-ribosyltransferase YbiA (DUF1768 family)